MQINSVSKIVGLTACGYAIACFSLISVSIKYPAILDQLGAFSQGLIKYLSFFPSFHLIDDCLVKLTEHSPNTAALVAMSYIMPIILLIPFLLLVGIKLRVARSFAVPLCTREHTFQQLTNAISSRLAIVGVLISSILVIDSFYPIMAVWRNLSPALACQTGLSIYRTTINNSIFLWVIAMCVSFIFTDQRKK